MARKKKKVDRGEKAAPDLTPMIDVTFQLLIFFILCTRFKVDERNHMVELPLDEGLSNAKSVPKEQITIYCTWDGTANHYKVAKGAGMPKVVEGSQVALTDMAIMPTDGSGKMSEKKKTYRRVVALLITAVEQRIEASGAPIAKLEISYAKSAMAGGDSGTAPWMFISLAIDAAARINQNRVKLLGEKNSEGESNELSVVFKFADMQNKYAAHE